MTGTRANAGYTYEHRVPRADAGMTLAAHLARRYRHADEEGWRQHALAGRVAINGRPADPLDLVREGDRVEYRRPPWEEPVVPDELPVIH